MAVCVAVRRVAVVDRALDRCCFREFWHAHYGKIAIAWSTVTLASLCWFGGSGPPCWRRSFTPCWRSISVSSCCCSRCTRLRAASWSAAISGRRPWNNVAILALGSVMASVVGTTGAAMILIRPLIRANIARQHNTHVVVFFIILVANVGGALSPLGDPPLFVGFLHGVDFFWTDAHLLPQTGSWSAAARDVLALDIWRYRTEPVSGPAGPRSADQRSSGLVNVPLIAAIVAAILLSANWRPGIAVDILGTQARTAEPDPRRGVAADRVALAVADPGRAPRGQRVHLGADQGSRETIRRDLHDDHPRAGRARRRAGRGSSPGCCRR